MRTPFFISFLLVLFISCKNSDKKTAGTPVPDKPVIDPLLITDSTWGLIHENMSFSDLQVLYGHDSLLKDARICGAECVDSVDVTILYPGSKNESTIYWKDSAYHRTISFIECYGDRSDWHTADTLKIGTGFKELLRLNGRSISFSGFGWDYGGEISSFNGGTLENSPIRYSIADTTDIDNSLYGDTELNTDMPAVKKELEKITIRAIRLLFNRKDEY